VVVSYPIMPVVIQFRGQKHSVVEVAVNPHLQHPLILGTNCPAFSELFGSLCAAASWEKKSKGKTVVVQVRDAEPGPLGSAAGEGSALERTTVSSQSALNTQKRYFRTN